MDLNKLSFNDGCQSIVSFGRKPLENQISIFGSKGSYHSCSLVRDTSNVKKRIPQLHAAAGIRQVAMQSLDTKAESAGALDGHGLQLGRQTEGVR
jgi:hypothetical protein